MFPLVIRSLLPKFHARVPPPPGHSTGAWTDDSKHRHTSCCRKRQFHLELHRSSALWSAKKCRGPRMRGVCDHGKTYHEGISSVSFLRRVGSMGVLIFESRVACPSAVPYTGTNIVKGTRLGGGAMVSGVRSGSGIRATAAGDRNKCGTVPVRWGPTIYVGWPRPADVYTLQGRTITPYRAPPHAAAAHRDDSF